MMYGVITALHVRRYYGMRDLETTVLPAIHL